MQNNGIYLLKSWRIEVKEELRYVNKRYPFLQGESTVYTVVVQLDRES